MRQTKFRAIVRHRVSERFAIDLDLRSDALVTSLYGPSGAGKSTVLKLVAGWLESDSQIFLDGCRLDRTAAGARISLRHRGVGMAFQDDLLFPHLDARGNAEFARRNFKKHHALNDTAFDGLVETFGIGHLMTQHVSGLSGGERQRIGLVRALAAQPRLLLCDEPVSAIDRSGRFEVLQRLKAHVEREGIVMILVTHDLDEIRRMAGHVWHVDSGRLVSEGPPEAIFGPSIVEPAPRHE
jgi:molybdate transport system ATP-binding protein